MTRLLCVIFCSSLGLFPRAFADMSDFQAAPARGATEDYARGELEFRLASSDLRAYSLNDFQHYKYVLLVAADSSQCSNAPVLNSVDSLIPRLTEASRDKIKVLVIDAGLTVDRPRVADQVARRWPTEKRSSPTYLFDSLQLVSTSLLFKSVGDYAIVDPNTTSVLATGSLADLNAGLVENFILGGKNPAVAKIKKTNGNVQSIISLCDLRIWNNEPLISFEEDFAKPFQRACLRCHSKPEPFNIFPTLDDVFGWRAMSQRTIRAMRMPGLHVAHYSGLQPNEASEDDLRKVVRWLSETSAINDEWRKVYSSKFKESQKKHQKNLVNFRADVTLETAESLSIPPTGPAKFFHIPLGKPAESAMAIHAVRFTTNLNSVHHANLFVFDPKTHSREHFWNLVSGRPRKDENLLFEGESQANQRTGSSIVHGKLDQRPHLFIKHEEPIIVTYSRRDGVIRFRRGTALVIPKGHQIGVQLHIEPSGRNETVPTKFELELMPHGQRFRPISRFKIRPRNSFKIRANQDRFISEGSFKTDRSISLLSAWFHAHYRAIAYRMWFTTPSGSAVDLLNIPFFQLKTEQSREFWPEGIYIPKGSEIYFRIEYDNSKMNNANPDSNENVELGGSIHRSEMHYPRFVYVEEEL